MQKEVLTIGVLPTRRNILVREEAIRQKEQLMPLLSSFRPDIARYIDIEDICPDGIISDPSFVGAIVEKFHAAKVDALFVPFLDFGCERAVSGVASELRIPTLVFGARDEKINSDAGRGRDTQCGMFAATKVLARYGIKYSYIYQCAVADPAFAQGFQTFLRVTSVLKAMKALKILKIGSRPDAFVSVATDEGSLMTRFGIECVSVSPLVVKSMVDKTLANPDETYERGLLEWLSRVDGSEMELGTIRILYAMKEAIAQLMRQYGCRSGAIECWPTMRDILYNFSICPCLGELADMGLPMSCETDINGAITMAMLQACNFHEEPGFLADLTIRHPQNDNAELLWHCGPFAYSLKHPDSRGYLKGAKERWQLRPGALTVIRFDDLNGRYSLFCGEGRTTTGPDTTGTYVWLEVDDWKKWEEALMFGPYIHHVGGIYGHHLPVFREVSRYLDITFDTVDSNTTRSL